MIRRQVIWTAIIFGATVALNILVSMQQFSLVRVVFAFFYMLVCPGLAYVLLIGLRDGATEFIIGVALSLAIDIALSLILVYGQIWSTQNILIALSLVTGIGLAGQIVRIIRLLRASDTETFA